MLQAMPPTTTASEGQEVTEYIGRRGGDSSLTLFQYSALGSKNEEMLIALALTLDYDMIVGRIGSSHQAGVMK